ncbi:MAG: serine hydrolase domain-containing protein, partial [Acidimicrobiia bacterium]
MTARPRRRPSIDGSVEAGFERVREAFAGNFTDGPEVGAAFAAYVEGRKVVDLWGGEARTGAPWRADTLGALWSATKGVTALCVQVVVERGELDLDAPVASYWPEFAAAGKEAVTTRHVLTHTAGMPTWDGYRELVTLADPAGWGRTEAIAAALAAAPPLWEPGRRLGYHAFTYGWLLGEIVRRVTGEPLGAWFRANVAAPLGLDLWIGLPPEHHRRVADLLPALPADPALALLIAEATRPDALTGRALLVGEHGGVDGAASVANDARFRAAEIPGGGGIGDARSLARLYG